MDNTVIKCLTKEHGAKIIKYFKSLGIHTGRYHGLVNEEDNSVPFIYYGLIKGIFGNYTIKDVLYNNATIIELPEELPKRGDRILVGDKDDFEERIFITYIEGTYYPIITVHRDDVLPYLEKEPFNVSMWKHWKSLPKEVVVELTLQDISDGKGKGVPTHLIRIKE